MVYSYSAPFDTGKLKVSDIHALHYEVSGNRSGTPVIFLHGGPGGGCDEKDRGFFNPAKYKVVFLDQRGAGRSIPSACLEENTTWDLVKDIERLREHLKIEKWHVFGGSWVRALGVSFFFFHNFYICVSCRARRFLWRMRNLSFPTESKDEEIRLKAARAWSKWEMSTSKLYIDPAHVAAAEEDDWANAFARIENHYFINEGFVREGQLLDKQEIDKIRHIPTIAVQGRYDVVCPPTTAYALKKAWPEITLHIVPDAGHSSREPSTTKLLIEATDKFADLK
ncbi:proline iminopeptidase [Lactarius quietus]|nr:proline iminopeptidase [Lactarius quietus]